MDSNLLVSQLTAAAALEYVLRLVQKWRKLPWITQHTQWITVGARAAMSLAAIVGISFQWNGVAHQLIISGLSATTIGIGLWHWFGQYALQHGWGQLLNVGTISAVNNPVTIEHPKSAMTMTEK
jgi:hypothetical protein